MRYELTDYCEIFNLISAQQFCLCNQIKYLSFQVPPYNNTFVA
jgi:hypothetical protein